MTGQPGRQGHGARRHRCNCPGSSDGHYRASPGAEGELRHVVQTEEGQQTLTPEEFAKKFDWKNEPEKVRLIPN